MILEGLTFKFNDRLMPHAVMPCEACGCPTRGIVHVDGPAVLARQCPSVWIVCQEHRSETQIRALILAGGTSPYLYRWPNGDRITGSVPRIYQEQYAKDEAAYLAASL